MEKKRTHELDRFGGQTLGGVMRNEPGAFLATGKNWKWPSKVVGGSIGFVLGPKNWFQKLIFFFKKLEDALRTVLSFAKMRYGLS